MAACRPFWTASPRCTELPRASVSCVPPLWSLSAGHLRDALEAGVTGVLQTLQAGVCVSGLGGYLGGALRLSSPRADPAILPL